MLTLNALGIIIVCILLACVPPVGLLALVGWIVSAVVAHRRRKARLVYLAAEHSRQFGF